MGIGDVKFKAGTAGLEPTTAEALRLKSEVEAALKQVEEAEKVVSSAGSDYKTEDLAELQKSKALLTSDLAALDYFLSTGEWAGPVLPAEVSEQVQFAALEDVDSGWCVYDPTTGTVAPPRTDADNNIYVENTGGIANLWFVMKSDDDPAKDMVKIEGETVGNDVAVTVTYKDNHTEEFIIKDGAIRTNIQIGVVGLKSEHRVIMDFSNTLIVNPKTGQKGGVYLIGSKFEDKIYGSAGVDEVNGAGGNDILDGMGGGDHVYGYAGADVLNSYGEGDLGADGDDQIFDRYATDASTSDSIDGGKGWDAVFRNTSALAATLTEDESLIDTNAPSEIKGWFSGSNGWTAKADGDELVVSQNSGVVGGVINIKEGKDYMISASKDGDDMILNVVKPGENGEQPAHYRVRIKDYFATDGVKLNITGGFVDLSGIDVGIRSVSLTGTGASGDVLIGPKTIFEEYAMDVSDLGKSSVSDSELSDRLKAFQENSELNPIWGKAEAKNGVILVKNGTVFAGDPPELDIPAELGAVAFVKHNADGSFEITVASNTGFNSERVVVKVENPPANLKITLSGLGSGYVFDLGKVVEAGVVIDGKDGADFTAGYKMGTKFADEAEKVELGYAAPIDDHLASSGSSAKTPEGLGEAIPNAKDFDALDEYQAEVDKLDDAEKQKKLQKLINTRRAELIDEEIGKLSTLEGEALTEAKEKIEAEIQKLKAKDKELAEEKTGDLAGLEGSKKD